MKDVKLPAWNESQRKTLITIIIIVIVLFVVYKILNKLGLIGQNAESKLKAQNSLNPNNYTPGDSGLLGPTAVTSYANTIYEAEHVAFVVPVLSSLFRYHSEDDDKVIGVFHSLDNKRQVSQLADIFYKTYSTDLTGFLNMYMLSSDVETINDIIDKLPA